MHLNYFEDELAIGNPGTQFLEARIIKANHRITPIGDFTGKYLRRVGPTSKQAQNHEKLVDRFKFRLIPKLVSWIKPIQAPTTTDSQLRHKNKGRQRSVRTMRYYFNGGTLSVSISEPRRAAIFSGSFSA
ncbi:uncharacterized protein G2W53_021048 [Senna tora]|uniref:Uncharacterized protein n=1 Tax=Senna tora TaxID=362788 RepID=A0A834WN36_9FABA|nr:uncharacterized protein G2W53_021048 [Senna tora]